MPDIIGVIFFIVTVILASVAGFCIICSLADQKFEEELAQEEKERKETENRLTTSLKILCAQLGIDVSFPEKLGEAAGQILYKKDWTGRLLLDDAKIQILKKYENEPWTLAHELGHYMAIKSNQDSSEEAADREADKLCRLILNKHEQELLKIALKCYFKQDDKDNKDKQEEVA